MKRAVLFGSCLALALGTGACEDQTTAPIAPVSGSELNLATVDLDRPAAEFVAPGRITDDRFTEAARRAINPGDYVCGPTEIGFWFNDAFNQLIADDIANLIYLYVEVWADAVPQYDAVYFLTDDAPQEFGYDGEYTNVMNRSHRDAKRFWDIDSDDIQLLAMKGSMLLDVDRVARVFQLPFGPFPPFARSETEAYEIANEIRSVLLSAPAFNQGDHPLFSFNAFAVSAPGFLPDKIIMGDGILDGYAALGYGDVAPQAVYAHEFAHHIQFDNGYFDDPYASEGDAPEQTRYTELMADAMSAYYLTHKRGAAMNKHRVAAFLEVFFEIGDCAFTNPGHHGTPNQRMAAAQWGFDLADQARKQGHILTSEQVHALFVAAYPELIAPDSP